MIESFYLAHYHLTLQALEPLHLPAMKGSALRGGFGYTFKRLVCFQSKPCGQRCELGNACPYGYVFETSPPEDSQVLRNLGEVARPFLIEPPADRREHIPAGEELAFGLTLIGRGINYLPYFIAVFRELGQVGLGRTRGKYRLVAVDGVSTLSPNPSPSEGEGSVPSPLRGEGQGGGRIPIYRAEDDMVRTVDVSVGGEAIMARAAGLAGERIALEFLTPTRLKHRGRWVQDGPPFHVLVRRLLDRVSSLSYFHCGQRLEADFRGLIERAEAVRAVEAETAWRDWSRFSGRQRQRVDMGGLVGRVTYAGELGEYLPLLALGELVHVGKGTVFGNGQFRVGSRDASGK